MKHDPRHFWLGAVGLTVRAPRVDVDVVERAGAVAGHLADDGALVSEERDCFVPETVGEPWLPSSTLIVLPIAAALYADCQN